MPSPTSVHSSAAKRELDEGGFVEGHQLDDRMAKNIPKKMGAGSLSPKPRNLLARVG
jgi:hypothetical protein